MFVCLLWLSHCRLFVAVPLVAFCVCLPRRYWALDSEHFDFAADPIIMLPAGAGTVPGRAGIANDMINLAVHGVVAGTSSSAHGVVVALSSEDVSGGSARSGITGTTGSVRSTRTRLTKKGVPKVRKDRRRNKIGGDNIPVRLKFCHQQLQCLICNKWIYTKADVPAYKEFGTYYPWESYTYRRDAKGVLFKYPMTDFCISAV